MPNPKSPTGYTFSGWTASGSNFNSTTARIGYSFTGWILNGTKITSTTRVKTASNHTLVAQWTANKYTVTFDPNGQ